MSTIKRDRFLQLRGGRAYRVELSCRACDTVLLQYQKDGDGQLKRCYLNRIIGPEVLLESGKFATTDKDLELLQCNSCKAKIGIPITYYDGRLAYRLIPNTFKKRRMR